MIGIVYLGNNPQTEERLKYIPGKQVQMAKNYKEAASACTGRSQNDHFIIFYLTQLVISEKYSVNGPQFQKFNQLKDLLKKLQQ